MIRPLKIAHTSDVHLCNGDEGLPVRKAFSQVVDAVVESDAELFLIAGDLFDYNRVHDDVVDFVYEQLARIACPTVVIVGNHDCWGDEHAVMQRMDFTRAGHHITLLDEVEGASVSFPELHATVWGRCMLEHTLDNKPMAGTPARTADMWHIGMAHGLYVDYEETGRSSLITPSEVEASGFDYLALGHVHMHRQMRHGNTLACYPGVCLPYNPRQPGLLTMVDLVPGEGALASAHMLPRRRPIQKPLAAAA